VLPEGAFQFLAGSVGNLLEHLGAQDALAFTGSSGTGQKLKSHPVLIRNNVRVNIEADSLNSASLGADVDTDSETYRMFLTNIVTDMTQKAGQKCTAVRRILVAQDRVETVVSDLVERLAEIKVGDPADDSHRMGPLASVQQLEDVRKGIEALAKVAKIACGGVQPIAAQGYFVSPTLLVANDAQAPVIHGAEVFGPVATVLPTDGSVEATVALANRGGGGLVASVYANDRDWTDAVVLGLSPWHGRVWTCSDKVAENTLPPGMVLPQMVHGGPGRAGGGEELGGLRGLSFYLQRTAVQGFQAAIARSFGGTASASS
jgi:oxepin-CoA hydrolase/3-oxo-5,6-dehydrosuberyl-CoA semialdehyde dehydrogenase